MNVETQDGSKTISSRELRRWMTEGRNFVLVDTLTRDHFANVHLPQAKNACVFEVSFLEQVAEIMPGKDASVVVYGSSDKTMDAATAAEKLVRAGYVDVSALDGGLARWRKAGYPLEGDAAEGSETSTSILPAEERTYWIDAQQSVIEWAGRNPNTKHHGTVRLTEGEVTVRKGVFSGRFEIDMTSIRNINLEGDPLQPVLISHLESDDFFFAKLFPKAIFTIQAAQAVEMPTPGLPNVDVEGSLELRGVRKTVRFPATVNPLPEGGISAEAHFDIDRTRWKVIYGSSRFFEHLGMHLVFDLISIQLRMVFR